MSFVLLISNKINVLHITFAANFFWEAVQLLKNNNSLFIVDLPYCFVIFFNTLQNNKFRKFSSVQNSPVSKRKKSFSSKSLSKYGAFSSRDDYDVKNDFFTSKNQEKRGILDEALTEQVIL